MVGAFRRRSRWSWLTPLLVVAAVATGLVVLSAARGSPGGTFSAQPCDPQAGPLPKAVQVPAETVILLDRSRSARGTPGKAGAPNDYAGTLLPTVRAAVEAGQTVSIAGFDGSQATVRWAGSVTLFRGDPTRRLLNVRSNLACLQDALRVAAASAPETDHSDVLGALTAAAARLGKPRPPGSLVVVATDGLANVGCADVDDAAIDDPGQIDQIVGDCRAAGAIPDLTGVEVRLLGLGQPGPGEPIPGTDQVVWLRHLWTALCEQTRASCDVDGQARRASAPPAALAPGAPADPSPRFPHITVRRPGTLLVIDLPDSLLFPFDSASLLSTAPLDRAEAELRRLRATDIKVEGHTDSRGGSEYNRRLSQRRAEAVAGELRRDGIAVSQVTGFGESRPKGPEYHADGSPDLRAMASDRRVQIVATVPGGAGG